MKRGIIFGIVGFALAYFVESQLAGVQRDMKRYDDLRAMSGEPPFVKDQLSRIASIVTSFVGEQTSSHGLLGSIPNDLVRYARISTM
ncbi:MAG TPA: hypothetical protein VMF61_09470 [Candidatus Acidoferrales bacterium]|nr:hypothetical protein [Candidatus Acidoferrales bacterium]